MTNEQHIENLKKLRSFHNGSFGTSINAAINALKHEQVLGEAFNIALMYGKEKGMEAIDEALYQMGMDGIKEQDIEVLEQESYKVSEYDKDHIWYKGRQYISLRRFLEVKKALEQEPCDKYIKEIDHLRKYIYKLETQIVEQESCEDAISRQAVLDTLDNMDNVLDEDRTIENYKELLKECYEVLPPVNPQPKTGHWIVHEIESTLKWLECSNCHCETSYKRMYNYCPDCGAKMFEPQESEEV